MAEIEPKDSEARVAFDLLVLIDGLSHTVQQEVRKDEKYFLELYSRCLKVTKGQSVPAIPPRS